jgi:streptomycin 6-kinase
MLNLPPDFVQRIKSVFGESGKVFLENLPTLIGEASARWGLTDIQPVSNLSYNFVAFAKRGKDDVVLKMGIPNPELISEIAALKLFNGEGACQVLASDEEHGFLLLERLQPGEMLSELEDDDERTHIAVDVMSKLWREVPTKNKFIQLSDWFDGLKKIRPHFNGGTGPFPKEILGRVESVLPELFADKNVKLMHGDFHHFNILSSARGWVVIDPKGVIGPVGYEIGPFMINPWKSLSDGNSFKIQAERRVSILAERLSWEREEIINWATAHAVLSAWWDFQDGMDWEYSINCAKIFSGIK